MLMLAEVHHHGCQVSWRLYSQNLMFTSIYQQNFKWNTGLEIVEVILDFAILDQVIPALQVGVPIEEIAVTEYNVLRA